MAETDAQRKAREAREVQEREAREAREAQERENANQDQDVPTDADGNEESQIVHKVNVVDPSTGQPKIVEHGPMPVSKWAAYERKHNL